MAAVVSLTPSTPDWERLKQYLARSAVGSAFFRVAAPELTAKRTTTAEDVGDVLQAQGAGFSRLEIIDLFKNLEKAGLGRFTTGRRGQPTRFEWRLTPAEAGRTLSQASGGEGQPPAAGAPLAGESPDDDRMHRFWLRRDREITFELPRDLSTAEAARLADYIRTLPLG